MRQVPIPCLFPGTPWSVHPIGKLNQFNLQIELQHNRLVIRGIIGVVQNIKRLQQRCKTECQTEGNAQLS